MGQSGPTFASNHSGRPPMSHVCVQVGLRGAGEHHCHGLGGVILSNTSTHLDGKSTYHVGGPPSDPDRRCLETDPAGHPCVCVCVRRMDGVSARQCNQVLCGQPSLISIL